MTETQCGVGLLRNHKKYVWKYRHLHESCPLWEKVTDGCDQCAFAKIDDCFREQIRKWAQDNGIPSKEILPNPDEPHLVLDQQEETQDVYAFLEDLSKNSEWEFVRPCHTHADPFLPAFRCIDDICFEDVDYARERNSRRSRNAARAKNARIRCKKECFFHEYCRMNSKKYCSAQDCQDPDQTPYGLEVTGPFSEHDILAAFEKFWEAVPDRRTPDEISLIAKNSGMTTHIFGHTLVMGRMDADLRRVVFYRPQTLEKRYFSFEDAVLLCKTPFRRCGGCFLYPGNWAFSEEKHHLVTPDRAMTAMELFTYAEICQHLSWSSYSYTWSNEKSYGFGYASPELLEVDWNGHSFEVQTHPGSARHIEHIGQIPNNAGWEPLPKLFVKYLPKASAGKDCQEPNQGTQP